MLLVVVHRHVVRHEVADLTDGLVAALDQLLLLGLKRCDQLLVLRLLSQQLRRRSLLLLVTLGDQLLRRVLRLLGVVELAARLAPRGVDLDDRIHQTNVCVPPPLRLAHQVRVAALVHAEELDVKHVGGRGHLGPEKSVAYLTSLE